LANLFLFCELVLYLLGIFSDTSYAENIICW
jgi:hypothetical protein